MRDAKLNSGDYYLLCVTEYEINYDEKLAVALAKARLEEARSRKNRKVAPA